MMDQEFNESPDWRQLVNCADARGVSISPLLTMRQKDRDGPDVRRAQEGNYLLTGDSAGLSRVRDHLFQNAVKVSDVESDRAWVTIADYRMKTADIRLTYMSPPRGRGHEVAPRAAVMHFQLRPSDLHVNVMQVAIDDMVSHLEGLVDTAADEQERTEFEARLKAAKDIKQSLE